MADKTQDALAAFVWQPQPAAAQLVRRMVDDVASRSRAVAKLADDLLAETGTRLIDWVDTIYVTDSDALRDELTSVGFEAEDRLPTTTVWRHAEGMFPAVAFGREPRTSALAIQVDSVDDIVASGWWPTLDRADLPGAGRNRRMVLGDDGEVRLVAVQRHGCQPGEHLQRLSDRPREQPDATAGFAAAAERIDAANEQLDVDWSCDLFFETERRYWMSRNHAARVQYARQQRLGLGWGNHDHHTYRSSRECFHRLIAVLEQLGFECRERFYAGQEAGWGAQVLEQPQCGLVVFADVDLSPEEIAGDIAHQPLPPRDELGTVGLWCALHGESFLQAGLHHLECQFDFDAAREQLAASGVETMAPFTDFPYLRQAFTQGEIWPVDSARIDDILAAGHITADQAEQFRRDGAIGSHLEILERNDGYKGFNQTGVSDIIARTDPRKWKG